MAKAEPIRKSSLPTTPPSEYEFHTVHGGQPDSPGVLLVPDDDSGSVVVRRRITYGDWEPVRPDHWAAEAEVTGGIYQGSALKDVGEGDVCRPVEVDGETIRVRGQGELSAEAEEALAALVRAAKAKFKADAPDQVGVLQNRLRLAHQARRSKEHQLDGIRRALCDAGFMDDDDPYSHADLADVIRQVGEALREKPTGVREQQERPAHPDGTPYRYHEIVAEGWGFCVGCHMWSTATVDRPHTCTGPNNVMPSNPEEGA
ncbi:hypothetical protein ACN6K5_003540 [Streptomyces violaceoruber]|uniref:hypothetical protein n=1 Tax=Streptomyces violaceoruber TaxID=1935 RepID=UPI00403C5478